MSLELELDLGAPARRGATHVAADRRVAWSEWGPPDGAPVLFAPGAATSSALGFATAALDRLGVRLIALDRPGLGRSDPNPDRSLLDFAADVRALAAARDLGVPAIVGFSQGAPFALACAAQGVVSAVAIVAGTDELAAPALRDALPPEVRRLIEQAEHDPLAGESFFRGMTPAMMLEMLHSLSPAVDLAVYCHPRFVAAFREALDEGFAQGPAGYGRDTLLAMRRWPFDVQSIRIPVHFWYGRHDASPFHSPDLGESLARRIPGATRTVVDGAGGALLWTHGAAILESLVAPPADR
ncbi:MAG TPA: alpha/beta fold hydrolase [Kofleriaceae bacterium]|nr:alpha/beta fold hydrolase [Kofleriaceae bacterium]